MPTFRPTDSDASGELDQRWVEIDLGVLAANTRLLKSSMGGARLMAVVKANGYGHGAPLIATTLVKAGADAFGVTTLDEAVELTDSGIDSRVTPVLVFAPLTNEAQVRVAAERRLHLTVPDRSALELLTRSSHGADLSLHLKIDVGMGRIGLPPTEALEVARLRSEWAGVYAHLPDGAEASLDSVRRRLVRLETFVAEAQKSGAEFGLRHIANSAAALRLPEARLDMVRIGTALYGQMPSRFVERPAGLSDKTFAVKARVIFTRTLAPGDTVGYGCEFTARRATKVAVLPVGFADGFGMQPASLAQGWRGLRGALKGVVSPKAATVAIAGQQAPVIGRIAMQMIVVDITDHRTEVAVGDLAEVPMRRLACGAHLSRRAK
jgi:alanine racemase